jgi:Family of unknown function (DUF6499)
MENLGMEHITPAFVPPDWKQSSNYPDESSTTNEEYAWEFLRRNVKYQADWNAYLVRMKLESNGDSDIARMFTEALISPGAFELFHDAFWGDGVRVNGKYVSGHPNSAWMPYAKWSDLDESLGTKDPWYPNMQSKVQSRGHQSLSGEFAEKWGLYRMVNPTWSYTPSKPEPPRFLEATAVHVNGLLGYTPQQLADVERRERLRFGKSETENVLQFGRLAAIIVNLERPIEVIEAEFSGYVRAMQEWRAGLKVINLPTARGKTARTRWQYTEFLRLFDALSTQNPIPATMAKVMEVMFQTSDGVDVKTVRERYRRACELVAGEYQNLLRVADPVTHPSLRKK